MSDVEKLEPLVEELVLAVVAPQLVNKDSLVLMESLLSLHVDLLSFMLLLLERVVFFYQHFNYINSISPVHIGGYISY